MANEIKSGTEPDILDELLSAAETNKPVTPPATTDILDEVLATKPAAPEPDILDELLAQNGIIEPKIPTPTEAPDNPWVSKIIPDERITQWSQETGIPEEEIRQYVVVKRGALDLVGKVRKSQTEEDLKSAWATAKTGFVPPPDTELKGAGRDLANNMLTFEQYPAKWTKGLLMKATYLPYVLDQYLGSKEERTLKDKIDQELKGDVNILGGALEAIPELALGGLLGKAAAPVVGKMAAPVVGKIKTLAERVGATAEAIPLVGTALRGAGSAAADYAALSAKVGTLTGLQSAAIAPRGEKIESGIIGFGLGAGIVTAGGVMGSVAGGTVNALKAGQKGMTKIIDNFGERAAEKVASRVPEEKILFDVAHEGMDVLPNDLNELRTIAGKLGVDERTVEGLKGSGNFIRRLNIQPVGEEIAERTRGVAEREAKIDLIVNTAREQINPDRIRAEEKLLHAMETNRPMPASITQLTKYADVFELDQKLINKQATSLALRERIGLPKSAMRTAFSELPDATRVQLRTAAYNDAIADYVSGLDRKVIKTKRELLNIAEGRKELFAGTAEYFDRKYEQLTSILNIPEYKLVRKTNEIMKQSRQVIGQVVESLSPENKLAVDIAAYKRAIEIQAQREYTSFATDFLPTFTKQRSSKVNLPAIFEGVKDQAGLSKVLQFDWIPGVIRREVEELSSAGAWRVGADRLLEWAGDITKGRSLSTVSMEGMRTYVNKAIHDEGNSIERIRDYWVQHRLNRTMLNEASVARANMKVATQGLGDRASKRFLPTHVVLDDISRRYPGMKVDEINLRLNNKKEMANQVSAEWSDNARELGLTDITTKLKEGGVDEATFYRMIEDPTLVLADKEKMAIVAEAREKWKGITDWMLDLAKGTGKKVAKRENYIHNTIMDSTNAIIAIRGELKTLDSIGAITVATVTDEQLTNAMSRNSDVVDLIKSIEWATATKIDSARALRDSVDLLSDVRAVAGNLSPQFAAAKQRSTTGGIPWLIREKDLEKITDKYIRQLARSAFLSEDLSQLHAVARSLDALGGEAHKRLGESMGKSAEKLNQASADAAFIRGYMRDVAGFGEQGWVSEKILKGITLRRINKLAEKYADDPVKLDRAIKAPGYMGEIISNLIYSSTLHRPSSFIKNLTQIPLVTANEIRGAAGTEIAMRSMLRAGGAVAKSSAGETFGDDAAVAVISRLKSQGKIQSHTVQEVGAREVAKGKGKLAGAAELSKHYAQTMLTGFGVSETINRTGTALFADEIVGAVRKGALSADDAFGLISSPTVKKRMMDAAGSGNITKVDAEIYEDYLLQKTQYVYTEVQKAKIIKDIGPILGAFMRYGSESTGIIYNRIRSGNMSDLAEQSVRQLTWLWLGEKYLTAQGEKSEGFKARREALIGKSSVAGLSTPVGALGYTEVFRSPEKSYTAKIIGNLIDAAKGDEKAAGATVRTVLELVPGTAQTATIVDDLYTRAIMGKSETPVRDAIKEVQKGTAKRWKEVSDDISDWFKMD